MLSLRDPEGFVFEHQGRIYRQVLGSAAKRLDAFLASAGGRALSEAGLLIDSRRAEAPLAVAAPARFAGREGALFEHLRIPVPSYPFEWHPLMLLDAADATLRVAQAIAADGYTLKDATPFNILFRGAAPVLVDLPSVDQRAAGYPFWLAEGQYIRSFALPLLAYAQGGLTPRQVFLAAREGLEPEAVARGGGWRSLFSLPHWLYAHLPALAQRRAVDARTQSAYRRDTAIDPARARFVYDSTLSRHRWLLGRIGRRVAVQPSSWLGYTQARAHYDADAMRAKHDAVAAELARQRPSWVLDIGANTGEFAEAAAMGGSAVVALDADLDSVGAIYRRAREKRLDVLPLHVNFASPSPGTGWNNRETLPLLERLRGRFDCVLMLAVIHHLAITEGLPLEEIVDAVAALTTQSLLIEHVDPADPMCQALLRGRDHLAAPLQPQRFERALARRFDVERRIPLQAGLRTLYECRRRG